VSVLVYTIEYVVYSCSISDARHTLSGTAVVVTGGGVLVVLVLLAYALRVGSLSGTGRVKSTSCVVFAVTSVVMIFGGGPRGGVGMACGVVLAGVASASAPSPSLSTPGALAPGGLVGFLVLVFGGTDLTEGSAVRVSELVAVTSDPDTHTPGYVYSTPVCASLPSPVLGDDPPLKSKLDSRDTIFTGGGATGGPPGLVGRVGGVVVVVVVVGALGTTGGTRAGGLVVVDVVVVGAPPKSTASSAVTVGCDVVIAGGAPGLVGSLGGVVVIVVVVDGGGGAPKSKNSSSTTMGEFPTGVLACPRSMAPSSTVCGGAGDGTAGGTPPGLVGATGGAAAGVVGC